MFKTVPILETKRLVLRQISLQDTQAIYNYGSNPNLMVYLDYRPFQDISEAEEFVAHRIRENEEETHRSWVLELRNSGEVIGMIDFDFVYDKVAEIEYLLHEEYWGSGLMSEAAVAVVRHGFEEMGLQRIEAKITEGNLGSVALATKVGMVREGTLRKSICISGQFRNVLMYALIREDYFK